MHFAISKSPLGLSLERQVRDRARQTAIQSAPDRRSITFAELAERVRAWVSALRQAGVTEGQTVSIALGNVLSFPEVFFALRSLEAPALLVDEASLSVSARMGASWILHRGADGAAVDGSPDPGVRLSPL